MPSSLALVVGLSRRLVSMGVVCALTTRAHKHHITHTCHSLDSFISGSSSAGYGQLLSSGFRVNRWTGLEYRLASWLVLFRTILRQSKQHAPPIYQPVSEVVKVWTPCSCHDNLHVVTQKAMCAGHAEWLICCLKIPMPAGSVRVYSVAKMSGFAERHW